MFPTSSSTSPQTVHAKVPAHGTVAFRGGSVSSELRASLRVAWPLLQFSPGPGVGHELSQENKQVGGGKVEAQAEAAFLARG